MLKLTAENLLTNDVKFVLSIHKKHSQGHPDTDRY